MRSKKSIIFVLFLLVIGFATISTSLILNGTLGVGAYTQDFQVYFSGAILEGVDMTNEIVKNQGQDIIYTSSVLMKPGETSRLDYEVTNASTQYGADVTIECFIADIDNRKIENHSHLEVVDGYTNEMELEPGETKPGNVIVRLKKSSVENDETKKLRCVIIANATSKEEYGNPVPSQGTYALSGYFVNEDGDAVSNAYLAVYSEEMHIVKTDLYGYFYVDGLERGLHEVYYLNSLNPTGLTKNEVKTQASGEVKVATNNNSDITFTNEYKIVDTAINNSKDKTNKTYEITLNPDGGTLANTTLTITENTRYGELPVPTRDGYNFNGWYFGEKIINSDIIVTSDNISEIKAKWSANNYTLTFNASGGSVTVLTKTVTYDENYGELPVPTRDGYTFDGWYKTDDIKVVSSSIYNIPRNVELYAKWKANDYEIKFDASGGTLSEEDQSKIVTFGNSYGTLPTPTRTVYYFDGWYTEKNGGTKITSDLLYNYPKNITLYAHWTNVIEIEPTTNMMPYKDNIGQIYAMTVTGSINSPSVWGTNIYTGDSNISAAAVHAGILKEGETGTVYIEVLEGADSYESSDENGYTSLSYGPYISSYRFIIPLSTVSNTMTDYRLCTGKVYSFTLTGSSTGRGLWGTDIYTDDSELGLVAVHAGILSIGETNTVYVEMLPGYEEYQASSQNGINSAPYGAWPASYRFIKKN